MEKMNITNQQHDAFVKSHPNGDYYNYLGRYEKLTGWYSRRIAVGKMVKLKVLASYYSKIPKLPYTLCYVSRDL